MIGATFSGPSGIYVVRQVDDRTVEVKVGDASMVWSVLAASADGMPSGMTQGAKALWGDEFWWTLAAGPPATIEYWGDGVLVRKDEELTQ